MTVHRFEGRDGRWLSFERVGSGEPILCHPGGPGFSGRHLGALGGLDERFELVLFNPRGTAESDPADDGVYSLDAYVGDLDLLREHLGLDRAICFGHSHGGFVVVRYASGYPDRVRAVVLDGTPLRVADIRFPQNGIAGYFARWDEAAQQYVEEHLSHPWSPAGDYFVQHEAQAVDITRDIEHLAVPCLVIAGDGDFATGASVATQMAQLSQQGQAVVIPGAGHFAWFDAPAEYARAVAAFVDSLA